MKIAIISNSEGGSFDTQKALSTIIGSDQTQTLLRVDNALHLERIEMGSTDIVIVDADELQEGDLRAISAVVHGLDRHPAFIYLSNSTSHEDLLKLIRAGATDVLHKPIHVPELTEAVERIRQKKAATGSEGKCNIISFISGKGGAGATFLATNFGYLLANEADKKVLFIDLHMQGGDAAFYLTNHISSATVADVVRSPDLDGMMIASAAIPISPNYGLLQSPDSPEKAAGLSAAHIDNLINVASQSYDYVIIDLPHILDALTIKALDRSDLIFVVTQPIMTYLRAVTHLLHLFSRLDYGSDKVRVVLNRMDNVGVLSVARVEDSIQKGINLSVPNDFLNAVEAVNLGVAIVQNSPKSAIAESLRKVVRDLNGGEMAAAPKKSLIKKMLGK